MPPSQNPAPSRRSLAPYPEAALPADVRDVLAARYRRVDRLVAWALAAHLAFALAVAPLHGTWAAAVGVGGTAVALSWWCARMWPGRRVTRIVAGIALQAFCALAVHQLRGMPEMHFFFFTSLSLLVLYEDWPSMWPGTVALVAQHLAVLPLHNAGTVRFYDVPHLGIDRVGAHAGTVLFAGLVTSYAALLLRRRTIEAAEREQRLRDSEARFRLLVDRSPDAIVVQARGVVRFANRAAAQLLGWDAPEQLVGTPIEDHLVPEQRARLAARLAALAADGELELPLVEYDLLHRDGTRIAVEGTTVVTRFQGEPAMQHVVRDVRRRRATEEALRESEQSHRALLEALPEAMLVHDGETIRYANATAARVLEAADPAALVGLPVAAICAPESLPQLERRLAALRGAAPRETLPLARYDLRRLDGSCFAAEMTSVVTAVGGRQAVVSLVRDTTARDRIARELEEQRRALHALVEAAPYGIVSVDTAWRVTQMNPAAERIFGWRAEEVIGGPIPWVAPTMQEDYLANRGRRSQDPVRPAALVRQRRDGRLIDVEMVELELHDDGGARAGAVAFFTDVTERRRSEEGVREFVQQASEGVWSFEFSGGVPLELDEEAQLARVYETGTLSRCNDAMARMYGFDRAEELVGTRLADMLPASDPRNVETLRHMIRSGYRIEGQETWEPDRHGALHCYSNNVVGIVQHGVLLRVWGTQRDVTAMRRVQVELEDALVTAREERMLARLAQREAEEASRAKSDFLAVMSHELRTPLNSVIGFASVLLRNAHGTLRPTESGYLERIRSNGRHLLSLINDILDLSKIEAGRMELRPSRLSPAALVGEVLGELGGVAVTRGIALRAELPEEPLELVADGGKLRQVLINLVGNALKFTHEGSVTVRVRAAAEAVVVEVVDTGIGIAPEHHERIFSAFQQAESGTARSYGGTGLGLAISRKLCELMGGTLAVESAAGSGSTFRVTLPAGAAVAAGAPALELAG